MPRGRADRNTEEGVTGRLEKVLRDEQNEVLRKVCVDGETEGRAESPQAGGTE